ncbi:MAG: hypothetical protein Q8N69_01000 [bacterium]|nr:hypothetical protein [bacterium]
MKKIYILIVATLLLFAGNALAQEIQYPIEKLGSCQSKNDCKLFCDKDENLEVCVSFAEKNNLMSSEEAVLARKINSGEDSPGGCKNKKSCQSYCDDIANIDECVTFAEKNNLMGLDELQEAKKVQQAIKRGVKPPPCKNKKSCDIYCENPENMEVCITFAAEAGFIEGKELEDVKKMLQAIKRGVKPLPCKGKEACDKYCNTPENMETCVNFALEAGFMPEEEKENAQKMLQAIKKGFRPPPCKGKEECDIYCDQEEHFEECINFTVAAGLMSKEDAVMARKTGGKGPGNCKGKEECEAFCKDPSNQETCFNFAKENGLIPEGDLKKMEEGNRQFKEALQQAPPEVAECLKTRAGKENIEEIKNEEIVRQCFEKFGKPKETGDNTNFGPKQTGPGGCQTPEECEAYCSQHREECGAPQEGQPMPPPEGFRPPEDFKPPMQEFNPPSPEPSVEPSSPQTTILKLLLGTIFSALKY